MITQSELTFFAIIVMFSLACADQDIKEKKVPNLALISALAFGLALRGFYDFHNLWLSALCGIGAGLFYLVIRLVTRGKLGIADVLFGAFQGIMLFPMWLFICVMIECAAAGGWFLILRLRHKNIERLPFIPFMAAGLIISYLISIVL